MATSHKHMRKINVNGKVYYYKIIHSSGFYMSKDEYCGDDYYPEIKVVMESPNGKVTTHKQEWKHFKPFTPKHVIEIIQELED